MPKGPPKPAGSGGGTPKGGGDGAPPPAKSGGDDSTHSSSAGDPPPPPKSDPPPPPKGDDSTHASSAGGGGGSHGGDTPPPPKSDPPPPPKTDPEPPPSSSAGSPPPGGTPKGSPESTTPSSGKPDNPRDTAVGKDDLVCKSDPVDIARGTVVLAQTDLELPSPLVLERLHLSSYRAGRWFGPSWTSTVDQRLEVDADDICYFSPDGTILVYPRVATGGPVLPVEGPRHPLTALPEGGYTLTDPVRGTELRFGRLPGRGGETLPLLAAVDADGTQVSVEYDEFGAPRLLTHSAGYRVELDNAAGRVTAIRVLGEGQAPVLVRTFGYDELGRLTRVINSSGLAEQFDYDADGRLTGWQDRNGTWYRYVYDAEGRCVRTVGDRGFFDGKFDYDRERRITRFTDSLGHTTEFQLNEAAQVVRETGPLGATVVSTWDRYDRLRSRTDALGGTTVYEYTEEGLLTAVIRPDGSRAEVAADPDGTLTVTVASAGRTWRRGYPPGTAPDLYTAQAGTATAFARDDQLSAGAPVVPTDDPVERDQFGRPRIVTDAAGGRTRLGWTVEGLPASRVGPAGRREDWRYDAEGNVVEHSGVRFEYGPFDLPVVKIDATGARTSYEYDTELRLIRITNPAGLSWSYTYDAAGRVTSETDFDGRVLRFAYDAAGRLVESVDGLGSVSTYAYDALGNVAERRTATGTTTYAYDPVGFLVRATEDGCVLEVERDEHGQVIRESVDGRAVTYVHDEQGTRRTTPSGAVSAWAFDEAGLPVTLSAAAHEVVFRYDAAGREVERAVGGAVVLAQAFDAEHRLVGQTVTAPAGVVQRRAYTYQPDGRLAGVDDALSGPTRYRLDPAGRVTGVARREGEETYAYDASGNILHSRGPLAEPDAGPRGYTGNRLSAAGAVRYAHDAQGRVIARHEPAAAGVRTWTYRWDARDRLVAVGTPEGGEWRYRYDPLGRRVAKQFWLPGAAEPAEETLFVWSGQLLVEQLQRTRDGQRLALTWDHVPGTVRPVTQTEQLGTAVRFFSFVTDQVGTPVDLVAADGAVAWHANASLWGRTRPDRAGGATPLRFPGQYADDETGLHYNVYRYYDPGTGRYLSQDPLGLVPAPNPVTYVPNPLFDADPLGLGSCMSKNNPATDDEVPPPNRPAQTGGGDAGHVQDTNPPAPSRPSSPPPDTKPGGSEPGPAGKSDDAPESQDGHDNDPASDGKSDHGSDHDPASDGKSDHDSDHEGGPDSDHQSEHGPGHEEEENPWFGGDDDGFFGMGGSDDDLFGDGPKIDYGGQAHHAEHPNDVLDRPDADFGKARPQLTPDETAKLDSHWDQQAKDNKEQYEELLKDPDHGDAAPDKTQIDEAHIGLDLNKQGVGPFADGVSRPSGLGGGDLIDGKGQSWDVKSMHSDWPPGSKHPEGAEFKDGYNDAKFEKTLDKQINTSGRNVIVDTRNANQQAIDSMNRIVNEKGWNGKVIFYP
ncbi:RHS repeat-associated core domain-containing protein [Amycolatopsis sp. NPDC051903]|uniref:RHS repeat-associated core domain-containing protein n=1 Tax=Amycolatopsis sp. NPDC051903 TaxID=3363936 RepID=UPI0037BCC152